MLSSWVALYIEKNAKGFWLWDLYKDGKIVLSKAYYTDLCDYFDEHGNTEDYWEEKRGDSKYNLTI